jgi:hypothetical protein
VAEDEGANAVGIRECAAVQPASYEGGEEAKDRQSGEDHDEIKALRGELAGGDEERAFHDGQSGRSGGLPDDVKARMVQPQRIRRVGAVQVERDGGGSLKRAEEAEEISGDILVRQSRIPFIFIVVAMPARPAFTPRLMPLPADVHGRPARWGAR